MLTGALVLFASIAQNSTVSMEISCDTPFLGGDPWRSVIRGPRCTTFIVIVFFVFPYCFCKEFLVFVERFPLSQECGSEEIKKKPFTLWLPCFLPNENKEGRNICKVRTNFASTIVYYVKPSAEPSCRTPKSTMNGRGEYPP